MLGTRHLRRRGSKPNRELPGANTFSPTRRRRGTSASRRRCRVVVGKLTKSTARVNAREHEKPRLGASAIYPELSRSQGMAEARRDDDLHQRIIEQLPHLRAFAVLLSHDRSFADDLVQEAVMRALAHADQFQPGTNFKAWITTILRNSYFNVVRQRSRVAPMTAVAPEMEPTTSGGQEEQLDLRDFERAFKFLPQAQREALMLVGAGGFSYEAAAEVAGCAVGTMKSRVARGRTQLTRILDGEGDGDDDLPGAVIAGTDRRHDHWMSSAEHRN